MQLRTFSKPGNVEGVRHFRHSLRVLSGQTTMFETLKFSISGFTSLQSLPITVSDREAENELTSSAFSV
jgi:hypothetical protein